MVDSIELQQVRSHDGTNTVFSSTYLSKQVLVSVTTSLLGLCEGFTLAYSAVVVPHIEEDPEFQYDDYYDSWIASSAPLSMTFGCLLSGVLLDKFGRKYTGVLMLWPYLIGYLILAFTKKVQYLFLGRFLTGISTGVFRAASSVYIVEVSDPKHKFTFQYLLTTTASAGVLTGHVIGKYLSPRLTCLIFSAPIFIAFVLLVFMKESPLWLISKGRIEEGIESFKWYRCNGDASDKELADILENRKHKSHDLSIRETVKMISSKIFMKAYMTGFFLFAIVQFCGINNLIFYAQDLLQITFSGKINAYLLMVITDIVRLIGNALLLIPVPKLCPKRISLFIITSTIVLLLIGIIVLMILKPHGVTWLLLTFLIIFVLIGGVLISLAWNIMTEIFPNEIRGIGLCCCSTTSYLLLFICVKLSPTIMVNYGVIAVYSTFSGVTLVSLMILLFMLPNVDGKSLQ